MSEIAKTAVYIGIAAIVGLGTYLIRPREEPVEMNELVGKPLFGEFKEPDAAASLKITVFDEELASTRKFEVAKKPGTDLWVIPSSEDYPADAEEQVRDAALAFIDLKALFVASQIKEDHAALGVLEPSDNSAASMAEGVGTQVVVRDQKNKVIADLIIGRQVKDSPGQRFVRKPTQDVVYVCEIDPGKFSTDFHDWIDTDLLQVNPFDVSEIEIKDYSIVQTPQRPVLNQRLDVALNFDETSGEWELERMVTFEKGQPKSAELGPEEELDTQRLNEMRNAFGDLKIVDVHRKPEGLGADLKAAQSFINDGEAVRSLMEKGFYPQPASGSNEHEILAENGEVILGTKNGIQYVMRFGRISATRESAKEGKLNRSLFVSARLDESQFVPPQMPELPKQDGTTDPADTPADDTPADDTPADEKPADEKPEPEDAKPAEEKQETPADEDPAPKPKPDANSETKEEEAEAAEGEAVEEEDAEEGAEVAEGEAAADAPQPGPEGPAASESPASESPASESPAGESPASESVVDEEADQADQTKEKATPAEDTAPPQPPRDAEDTAEAAKDQDEKQEDEAGDKPGDPPAGPATKKPSKTELQVERARLEKEYQRQLDEYQERLKQAKLQVTQANGRFADWYYIIPEDVYEKVHLGRSDIVKKKEAESDAGTEVPGPPGANPSVPFNFPMGPNN